MKNRSLRSYAPHNVSLDDPRLNQASRKILCQVFANLMFRARIRGYLPRTRINCLRKCKRITRTETFTHIKISGVYSTIIWRQPGRAGGEKTAEKIVAAVEVTYLPVLPKGIRSPSTISRRWLINKQRDRRDCIHRTKSVS